MWTKEKKLKTTEATQKHTMQLNIEKHNKMEWNGYDTVSV